MRVAVDGMGGDFGPGPVVRGVVEFRRRDSTTPLVLVGDEERLKEEFERAGLALDGTIELRHASQIFEMTDGFAALSKKPDSSIVRAVELVKEGEAEAAVSVGNTVGAVAAAQLKLRLLPGVKRAGIAVPLPSLHGTTVVIDMGAGVAAKPEHLLGYAIMASIYTEEVLGTRDPTVALLNVGSETSKGDSVAKKAYALLEEAPINFRGNAEGSDIYRGRFDVIVCDGFVGNVVLKASEAAAHLFVQVLREEFAGNGLRSRLGAFLAGPALKEVRRRLDYAEWGGAPLLGVKGVFIKGHGRSNAKAVANAIRVAAEAVRKGINDKIVEKLRGMRRPSSRRQGGPERRQMGRDE